MKDPFQSSYEQDNQLRNHQLSRHLIRRKFTIHAASECCRRNESRDREIQCQTQSRHSQRPSTPRHRGHIREVITV